MPQDQGKVVGNLIAWFPIHVDVRGRRFVASNGRLGSIGSPKESINDSRRFKTSADEEQDRHDVTHLIVKLHIKGPLQQIDFDSRKAKKGKGNLRKRLLAS